MFYKSTFISIADILEAKLKAYERDGMNAADKGELCEDFIKDFLVDCLGDLYKIFRGGKIVNVKNECSNQIDVIICRKRTLKLFSDKGIYPVETVMGAISITATLTLPKLIDCCKGLMTIPKRNYRFNMHQYLPDSFKKETLRIYELATPFTCVFAYKGNISEEWINSLYDLAKNADTSFQSLLPSVIVVNKKGMIIKKYEKVAEEKFQASFHYVDLSSNDNFGDCYGRIVNELFNLSSEENNLHFDYTDYFNADLGIFE